MTGGRRPTPGVLPTPPATIDGERVAIVVVNWNALPFLRRALDSIVRYTADDDYELIVVDNGSGDGSSEWLRGFEAPGAASLLVLQNPENRYFSAAFNQGFAAASPRARYLAVFYNDVEVKRDGWLRRLREPLREDDVIAVGQAQRQPLEREHAELLARERPEYADDTVAARIHEAAADPEFEYEHLFGYCFLLDRLLLARVGGYMEGGAFRQYHSDWELYLRFAVHGYRVASLLPDVHHWHSISELIAEHPEYYRDLVAGLEDPGRLALYLQQGRPLFPGESGYEALRRKCEEESG